MQIIENKDKSLPGVVVKSKDENGEFFWVTWPGERPEEFETQAEAEQYLEDRRNMFKRSSAARQK